MAIDVTKTLRQALAVLEAEKARISRQIESIQQVLAAGSRGPRQAKRRIGTQVSRVIQFSPGMVIENSPAVARLVVR